MSKAPASRGQSLDPALVNQAVHQHLLVAGRFEIAAKFADACGLNVAATVEPALRRMHDIEASLEGGDTKPLLEWIDEHRENGLRHHIAGQLTFEVHHLEYAQRLNRGDTSGALIHLRKHLAPAAARRPRRTAAAATAIAATTATTTTTTIVVIFRRRHHRPRQTVVPSRRPTPRLSLPRPERRPSQPAIRATVAARVA